MPKLGRESLKALVLKGLTRNTRIRTWIFRRILLGNRWGDSESVSGKGSNLAQTENIRRELPSVVQRYEVESMLDIPCGDGNWIRHTPLGGLRYVGADVLPELIEGLRARSDNVAEYVVLDATINQLPAVDMILCRDLLVHLEYSLVWDCLSNFVSSGSMWLLTTSFTARVENADIPTGRWRPLNLERDPFRLPAPSYVLNEKCTEGGGEFADKSLCLWPISDVAKAVRRRQRSE